MIQSGFLFIAFIMCFAALVFYIEEKTKSKFFEAVPPLVIIYFGAMLMSTFGLWTLSINGKATPAGTARSAIKDAILPSMIFLMLLKCDMRSIMKLGTKMLLSFFSATVSIVIGFTVTFALLHSHFMDHAWQTFGALAGSWTGGVQNMVAVQEAIGLEPSGMGYTLLIDSIDYSIWIMMLLFFVSNKFIVKKFNKFNKADTSVVESVSKRLQDLDAGTRDKMEFVDLFGLVAMAFGVGAVSTVVSPYLPQNQFFTPTTWMILIATVLGILAAMTPMSRIPGSRMVSNVMLYTLVGLIASSANFAELGQAPIYILAGFMILLIHALFMLLFAKLFKIDLFTCAIASCANIGGVASSPVIAGAYNEALVPVGVLMGMLGAIIGTGVGVSVAHLLHTFV